MVTKFNGARLEQPGSSDLLRHGGLLAVVDLHVVAISEMGMRAGVWWGQSRASPVTERGWTNVGLIRPHLSTSFQVDVAWIGERAGLFRCITWPPPAGGGCSLSFGGHRSRLTAWE